jgi:hypothetical protein
MACGLPIRERLEALDAFVRDHPGTIAAAKALYHKGFQLGGAAIRTRPRATRHSRLCIRGVRRRRLVAARVPYQSGFGRARTAATSVASTAFA